MCTGCGVSCRLDIVLHEPFQCVMYSECGKCVLHVVHCMYRMWYVVCTGAVFVSSRCSVLCV